MSQGPRRGSGRGIQTGGMRRRGARQTTQNARLVWPPRERAEGARDAIERLMREAGLVRGFEDAVEREARGAAARAWERAEREARVDLRALPTFTVDPTTARDFDDAISAEWVGSGAGGSEASDPRVRVWVHIADVAAHVPLGSQLDLEARRRGTSVYLPGAVEPMLPHELSADACSLAPGVERLAVTVELQLRGAQVLQSAFYRSIIRSDARLDYAQVDRIFSLGAAPTEPWGVPLGAARAAAAALQRARDRSGALVIDSREPEFEFDRDGNVSAVRSRTQTESHRLIEHLMIAANEAVARQLTRTRTACLYRVHERPEPERIRTLVAQLGSLGVATPSLPDPLFSTHAAELVGEISQRIDAHVRRTGHGRAAFGSLLLRALQQAHYSPRNLGHAGLHTSCYCHFTSPIRRYPDLVCHRALLASIGADERALGRRRLVEIGESASEREREAAALEHKGDDVAACFRLEQILLEEGYERVFEGEVTGVIAAGVFVAFSGGGGATEGMFEGMLPVRLLSVEGGRDWWSLNEPGTILQAERSGAVLRLGDPISVRVARVDSAAGRVDLVPALTA